MALAAEHENLRKKPWKKAAREAWDRLRGGDLTPARAATSVAVGLAIGVTPLWGVHFLLVIAVCVPFRLDVVLAYVASNISLPFIAPFLTFAEMELGARALTGAWLPRTTVDAMRAHGLMPFVKQLVVGTALFAPMMASAGYAGTYVLAKWIDRKVSEGLGPLLNDVAERYARGDKTTRIYVRSKMMGDPVVRAVLALGGEKGAGGLGEVVDVGCGRGQLALALALGGGATKVTGLDWDEEKVEEARAAATGVDSAKLAYERADVLEASIPACDTALFIDLLHYLKPAEQDALLARAADAARRRVIVRELDPDRGWRSTFGRVQEKITTSLGFNRGARLVHRPIRELAAILEARGYAVEVTPCWGKTPFANVLLIATRRAVSA